MIPQWNQLVSTFTVVAAWVAVADAVIGGVGIIILIGVADISIVFDVSNVVGICRISRSGIIVVAVVVAATVDCIIVKRLYRL